MDIRNKEEYLENIINSSKAVHSNYQTRLQETKLIRHDSILILESNLSDLLNLKDTYIVVQATGSGHKSWLENNNIGKFYEQYGIVKIICKNLDDQLMFRVSYKDSDKEILIPVFLPPYGEIKDIRFFETEELARLFCEVNNNII